MKRSARTASINKTVTTMFPNRDLDEIVKTKPTTALTWNVHKKIRQEALDAEGSFRNDNLPIVPRVLQLASASSAASQAPGRLAAPEALPHDRCPATVDCMHSGHPLHVTPSRTGNNGRRIAVVPPPRKRMASRAIACRATAWSYATCAVRPEVSRHARRKSQTTFACDSIPPAQARCAAVSSPPCEDATRRNRRNRTVCKNGNRSARGEPFSETGGLVDQQALGRAALL